MIEKSTIAFLSAIRKNNNREWFEKNRDRYEAAKANFEEFTGSLIKSLATVNPALGNLRVRDCVFRIYRDVRFSKNKTPYKTNMGAYFAEGGKKSVKSGFYIQLEPGKSFAAAGCWMPMPPELKLIRQEIDYNLEELLKILKQSSFRKYFKEIEDARIKTTPKGYDASNPAIEYLRQTSFVVTTPLNDDWFLSPGLIKNTTGIYKAAFPFIRFLNTALG